MGHTRFSLRVDSRRQTKGKQPAVPWRMRERVRMKKRIGVARLRIPFPIGFVGNTYVMLSRGPTFSPSNWPRIPTLRRQPPRYTITAKHSRRMEPVGLKKPSRCYPRPIFPLPYFPAAAHAIGQHAGLFRPRGAKPL